LRGVVGRIRELSAELVAVGNGTPWHAAAFRDEAGIDFPLLVCPGLEAYRAAGLKRTYTGALHWRTWRRGLEATRKGFRQSRTRGDAWQLGGTLVVAPGDRILFEHRARDPSDHPDPEAVLAALARRKG
jgi:peroxiredoxin